MGHIGLWYWEFVGNRTLHSSMLVITVISFYLPGIWHWYNWKSIWSLWRTVWRFLKKLKIELPYYPAIPLLGIYLEKTIIRKDTCTPIFIATLFTLAKTWKQPKCPLTEEWIKKMWYIYTMEYYSAIKKNEIMLFAAKWMDLEIITLSEVRQRKTNIIWYHSYVESNF